MDMGGRGRTEVVESIQDNVEGLKPGNVELWLFNVRMDGCDVHGGVEGTGGGCCDL
jgi:hypothetical protein